jgi:hypothetical protein
MQYRNPLNLEVIDQYIKFNRNKIEDNIKEITMFYQIRAVGT